MRGLSRRGKVYWMDYRVNGKRYRESTGTTLRREAEYLLACRKKEAKEGKIPEIKKIKKEYSFAKLAKNYLKWAEKQKGYKSKKSNVSHLVGVFGMLDVNDLNTRIVEQWQTKILKMRKPATANRRLACLKHMLTKAVDWKLANEETLKQVRKVEFEKENNRKLRYLDIDECQRLIECCSPHLKPIVIVALNTGMRRGEILSLEWEQVDLRHGYILLDNTKSGEGRQIPINTTLLEMFSNMPRGYESKYVFANRNGDPLTDVKRSFKTALRKAEIVNATFHTLRHTCASHLVMAGVDLPSVKEILGHKTLAMTMRYAHLAPGHKRNAVKILDSVLSGNCEKYNCDQIVSKTYQNT